MSELLAAGFLWRAVGAAALLGAAAGPLGCFVLWRRLAYLGESIAHLGLLGAALGLLLGVAPLAGVAAVALAAAFIMARARDHAIPAGMFIGLVGHVGLALGFVLLAQMETVRADLLGYLFGDVLAVAPVDLWLAGLGGAAILAVLALIWRPLLFLTVSRDVALAEGGGSAGVEAVFLVLVAALVALALKIVGVLLIVALLLIPSAAARPLARTPEGMALMAAGVGAAAAPLGLAGAFITDAPASPAIVLAAAALFALSHLAATLSGARRRG